MAISFARIWISQWLDSLGYKLLIEGCMLNIEEFSDLSRGYIQEQGRKRDQRTWEGGKEVWPREESVDWMGLGDLGSSTGDAIS